MGPSKTETRLRHLNLALASVGTAAFLAVSLATGHFPTWQQSLALIWLTAEFCAIAVWLGLGSQNAAFRFGVVIIPDLGVVLLVFILDRFNWFSGDHALGVFMLYLFTPFMAGLCLVARSLGFRIVRIRSSAEDRWLREGRGPIQISLKQMFALTAVVACLAFLARSASRDNAAEFFGGFAAVLACLNLIAAGAGWAALGESEPILRLVLLAVVAGGSILIVPTLLPDFYSEIEKFIWISLCELLTGVILLLYRILGFRIIRVNEGRLVDSPDETANITLLEEQE